MEVTPGQGAWGRGGHPLTYSPDGIKGEWYVCLVPRWSAGKADRSKEGDLLQLL